MRPVEEEEMSVMVLIIQPERFWLTIRLTLGFRKAEVHPDGAEKAGASPKEGRPGTPIPCRLGQLVVGHDVDEDVAGVVGGASEHDGLGLEAGGRQLRDKTVGDGADGEVVDKGEDDQEGANDPNGGI